MTKVQIDQIVADYARINLSPRKPERDMITKRYEQLKGILAGQTFQNGSYARHTSTTPVNDLDVFYILPESVRRLVVEARIKPEELTIENILQDLAQALRKEYMDEAQVVVQPHSVGIFFGSKDEFSIDVVPAQPSTDGLFWVPESSLHSIQSRRLLYESLPALRWIKSDPQGYITQATVLDQATSGTFRKAAKFVKKWRHGSKHLDEKFPLKSFHVEIIMTEILKANQRLTGFEAISQLYSVLPAAITHPQYPDRADKSRYIDDYVKNLTAEEKSMVSNEQARVMKLITQIQSVTTEALILRVIEDILHVRPRISIPTPAIVSAPRVSPAYSKPYRH